MTPGQRRLLILIVCFVGSLLLLIALLMYRFVTTNPGSHSPPRLSTDL